MNRCILSCAFAVACLTLGADQTSEENVAVAIKETPKIDGKIEAAWKGIPKVKVNNPISGLLVIDQEKMATATVQIMWDEEHLYTLWRVKDSALSAEADDAWEQDSVEFFLDQNKERTTSYESDDAQYRVNFKGELSGQGEGYDESDLKAATANTDDGYIVEMSVRVLKKKLEPGAKLGFELQVNDDHFSGTRDAVAKWHHTEDDSWEDTSNFGTLELK